MSDAALATCSSHSTVIVAGGDIFEALGRPQPRHESEPCMQVRIDALRCDVTDTAGDTTRAWGASCVSIGRFLRGEFIMISNSGFWKGRHIAPRSHPNDGQFDLLSFSPEMSTRQRVIAYNKMKTSTHLPHPNISSRRDTVLTFQNSGRRSPCLIDGVAVRDWQSITVTLIPDYWTVIL